MARGVTKALVVGMKDKIARECRAQKSRVITLDIQWSKESRREVLVAQAVCEIINAAGRQIKYRMLGLIFFAVVFAQLQVFAVQNVTLTWNPSNDPNVAGYNVYYGGTSGVYTNEISVGSATNVTISGLVEGATYYFAATTHNNAGLESSFSSEASYSVPAPAVLSLKTIMTGGIMTSVSITASGTTPEIWTLESSTDLKNWSTIAQGTNAAINVSVPVNGIPSQFFRLKQ